jgi:hypothetical protein
MKTLKIIIVTIFVTIPFFAQSQLLQSGLVGFKYEKFYRDQKDIYNIEENLYFENNAYIYYANLFSGSFIGLLNHKGGDKKFYIQDYLGADVGFGTVTSKIYDNKMYVGLRMEAGIQGGYRHNEEISFGLRTYLSATHSNISSKNNGGSLKKVGFFGNYKSLGIRAEYGNLRKFKLLDSENAGKHIGFHLFKILTKAKMPMAIGFKYDYYKFNNSSGRYTGIMIDRSYTLTYGFLIF